MDNSDLIAAMQSSFNRAVVPLVYKGRALSGFNIVHVFGGDGTFIYSALYEVGQKRPVAIRGRNPSVPAFKAMFMSSINAKRTRAMCMFFDWNITAASTASIRRKVIKDKIIAREIVRYDDSGIIY